MEVSTEPERISSPPYLDQDPTDHRCCFPRRKFDLEYSRNRYVCVHGRFAHIEKLFYRSPVLLPSAIECTEPAASLSTSSLMTSLVDSSIGTSLYSGVRPTPNCPSALEPKANSFPDRVYTSVCAFPQATSATCQERRVVRTFDVFELNFPN